MASAFKSPKGFIPRLSPAFLTVASLIYSFFMWQLISPIITLPVYITAPIICAASLPISGSFLWFLKNGKGKLRIFLFLYALPSVIPWIICGYAYVSSSFFGGEFFSSLVIYTTSMGWGITLLCLNFASALTLLLFAVTKRIFGKH